MTDATHPAKKPGGITGKGFKPGDDPRRYRGGGKARAGIDALRKELIGLLDEPARDKRGEVLIGPNGKAMTQREAGLRRAIADPKQFLNVLEIAYGPFTKQVEVSGGDGGPIETVIRVVYGENGRRNADDSAA